MHPQQTQAGVYPHPAAGMAAAYSAANASEAAYREYYAQSAGGEALRESSAMHYLASQQQRPYMQQLQQQQQQQYEEQQLLEAQMQQQQRFVQQQQQQFAQQQQQQFAQQQQQMQQFAQQQQRLQQMQQQQEACSYPLADYYPGPSAAPGGVVMESYNACESIRQNASYWRGEEDALTHSIQQSCAASYNAPLSSTVQSIPVPGFDELSQTHHGGMPHSQTVELQFECLDNITLSHPAASVSLCCFVHPEDENNNKYKIGSVIPYVLSNDPRGEAARTPQAFVDFKGAKVRLQWRGEEFLHLKINEEVEGLSQSTGFIKLHFSSLQENIPMRVDVIDQQGRTNGFLILRYSLLNELPAAASYPSAAPTAATDAAATASTGAVSDLTRLPTLPSNFSVQQQMQQQKQRSFAVGELQHKQPERRPHKQTTIKQKKQNSGGMFSRFGRWCCELPSVDLN